MLKSNILRPCFVAISLTVAVISSSAAPAMVSIKGGTVNMRAGPDLSKEVLWELQGGYPLEVLKRQGSWLQVQDFENDRGWIFKKLTNRVPHHIVKARIANIRSGPGTGHKIVGQAVKGDLLLTREKRKGWVRIDREFGQSGWIARRLVWGW